MVNLERSQAYNKRLKADRLEKSHEVAGRLFQHCKAVMPRAEAEALGITAGCFVIERLGSTISVC